MGNAMAGIALAACPMRPALLAGRVGRSAMLLVRSMSFSAADQADDAALIALVAQGDAGAYRTLADRYLAAILRYAARMLGDAHEAEDVAQETFLRLWQQASRYAPRDAKPSTWLYRIAHNSCVDRLRRRKDQQDVDALELRAAGDRPSGALSRKELARSMEQAFERLPERQRAAVVLVHHEGLTQSEAAAVLACGEQALESLLSRGRRSLRKLLADAAGRGRGEST